MMYMSRASTMSRARLVSSGSCSPLLRTQYVASSFVTTANASTLITARNPRAASAYPLASAPHHIPNLRCTRWSSSAALASTSPEAAKVAEDAETDTENDPFRKIGYLYFDTVFPIRLGFWDIRYMVATLEKRSVLDRVKASLPPDHKVGYGFKVIGAEERMKDGGAFVTFSYREDPNEKTEESLSTIEKRLKSGVRKVFNPLLFFLGTPGVHVVRGKPFREDMNISRLQGSLSSSKVAMRVKRRFGKHFVPMVASLRLSRRSHRKLMSLLLEIVVLLAHATALTAWSCPMVLACHYLP